MVVGSPAVVTVACSRGQAARRLHGGPQHDGHAARDAPEHAAVTVGAGFDAPARGRGGGLRGAEQVVVLAAAQPRAAEPHAVLDPQHRRQAEQRLGEVGLELVEDRLAETRRHPGGHDLGHPPDRIARLARLLDQRHHLGRAGRVGAPDDVRRTVRQRLHLLLRHRGGVRHLGHDVPDLADVADHAAAEGRGDDALGDHPSRDAGRRLARARAAAAAVVAPPVLRVVGVVGVARPVLVPDIAVVAGALIDVADENRDARAGRLPFEDPGQDLRRVGLVPRGDDPALAGAPPGEVLGEIRLRERKAGRTAVDDDDVAGAVRLAGGGDAKAVSERIAGHGSLSVWDADARRPRGTPRRRALDRSTFRPPGSCAAAGGTLRRRPRNDAAHPTPRVTRSRGDIRPGGRNPGGAGVTPRRSRPGGASTGRAAASRGPASSRR